MSEISRQSLTAPTSSSERPVKVLYEDDFYIVFDKPAGLLVIPADKGRQRTLTDIVNQLHSAVGPGWRLHPCHRIDQETSGAIVYAKGKKAQQIMMDLFRKRAVAKTYIAFVHGKLKRTTGEFRNPVRDPYRRLARPAPAVTQYKVIQVKKYFSVVEVQPVTGRTNQIRIHFSEAGHPLVGDRKFAFARDYALKFRRTALHAASLAWTHPVSRQKIHVHCDVPKDMKDFLSAH